MQSRSELIGIFHELAKEAGQRASAKLVTAWVPFRDDQGQVGITRAVDAFGKLLELSEELASSATQKIVEELKAFEPSDDMSGVSGAGVGALRTALSDYSRKALDDIRSTPPGPITDQTEQQEWAQLISRFEKEWEDAEQSLEGVIRSALEAEVARKRATRRRSRADSAGKANEASVASGQEDTDSKGPVLSPKQSTVVDEIHAHWLKNRAWPQLGRLRVMLKRIMGITLEDTLESLPGWIVEVPATNQDQDPVRLTLRGFSLCKGSEAIVAAFLGLHRKGAELFLDNPNGRPQITSSHLRELLPDMSKGDFEGISEVVYQDFDGGSHGRGEGGAWWMDVAEESLKYRPVNGMEEWFSARHDTGEEVTVIEERHVGVLKSAYEYFSENGSWPDYLGFVVRHRDTKDIVKVLREMPRGYFFERAESSKPAEGQTQFRLTFPGVLATGLAEADLGNLLGAVRLLYQHYGERDGDKPVPSAKIGQKLGLGPGELQRLGFLIHEASVGVSVSPQGEGWNAKVSSLIERFDGVKSVDDMLATFNPDWKGNWRKQVLKGPARLVASEALGPFLGVGQLIPAGSGTSLIGHRLQEIPIKILESIGDGGSANVYRGQIVGEVDGLPPIGADVAVKITQDWLLTPNKREETKQRVEREGSLKGKEHPHIAKSYGAYEEMLQGCSRPYVVLEYIKGVTLKQWVGMSGAASIEQCARFLDPVIEALEFLHSEGIIHRDIKPSNVMVDQKEGGSRIVLMDLGIAHFEDEAEVTETHHCMGTKRRASPEFLFRLPPEAASRTPVDIYSLGTLAYDLIMGKEFFGHLKNEAQIAVAVRDTIPEISRVDFPNDLIETTRAMLAKRPEGRPVLADIKKVVGSSLGGHIPKAELADGKPGQVKAGERSVVKSTTGLFELAFRAGDISVRPTGKEWRPGDPLWEILVPVRITTFERKVTVKQATLKCEIAGGVLQFQMNQVIHIGPTKAWLPWVVEHEEVHDVWLQCEMPKSTFSIPLNDTRRIDAVCVKLEDQRGGYAEVREKRTFRVEAGQKPCA